MEGEYFMKKVIISLLLFVPLLTGCTNIDTQVTINNDKSASVVSSLTYQGDLSDKIDPIALTIMKNYKSFVDPLYNVETAYGAKLSTITVSKNVKKVDYEDLNLSSLGFNTNLPSGKYIEVKKNPLMASYNVDVTYDLTNQLARIQKAEKPILKLQAGGLTPEYYQKYGDIAEIEGDSAVQRDDFIDNLDDATKEFVQKNVEESDETTETPNIKDLSASFSIKLPSPASYNNADSSEGNVYTWKLKNDAPTIIKLQYIKYNGFAITFLILVGISIIVFIARKIVKHDAQRRVGN